MGMSTLYANIVLMILILTAIAYLGDIYKGFYQDTTPEVVAQSHRIKDRLDTSIRIIKLETSGTDVIFEVLNEGSKTLSPNCTDVYIDRQYQIPDEFEEIYIQNTTVAPGAWDPGEQLRIRVQYAISDSDPHEGKVVTCNGVMHSKLFYG